MTKLSPRLQLVFEHLLQKSDVWDICCDHGYLGGAAYKSQLFKNVYFVDPIESIMTNLQTRFNKYVFSLENLSTAYFKTELGQNIQQDVNGTVCLIGVGGMVIYEILNGLLNNNYLQAQRLILGPHRDTEKLLDLLKNNKLFDKYQLTSKKEIIENTRVRIFYIFDMKV